MLGVGVEARSDMRKPRLGGVDLLPVTIPRPCDGSLPSVRLSSLPSAIVDQRVKERVGGRLDIIGFDLVATEQLPIGQHQARRARDASPHNMEGVAIGDRAAARVAPAMRETLEDVDHDTLPSKV